MRNLSYLDTSHADDEISNLRFCPMFLPDYIKSETLENISCSNIILITCPESHLP